MTNSRIGLGLAVIALSCGLAKSSIHAQAPVGVQEPAWAPDGRRIAVSYLDRIWTMTPEGRQGKAVMAGDGTAIEREPAWSPDGTRLAYAADRGDGFDIMVVAVKSGVASGAPVAATTLPGDERWPSWTADGRLLYQRQEDVSQPAEVPRLAQLDPATGAWTPWLAGVTVAGPAPQVWWINDHASLYLPMRPAAGKRRRPRLIMSACCSPW